MNLIHLSDLHIKSFSWQNKELKAKLDFVQQNHTNDTILITGDITDNGFQREHKQAIKLLTPFKPNIYVFLLISHIFTMIFIDTILHKITCWF